MNKICTSIEQSKKLIELGLDVNTADMYWLNRHIDLTQTKYEILVVDKSNKNIDFFNSYAVAVEKGEIIPAWSLSSLLDMLDYEVVDGEGESCYLKIDKDDIGYQIRYEDRWNSEIETKWYDNPLDAAFEMVVWLKENGKT